MTVVTKNKERSSEIVAVLPSIVFHKVQEKKDQRLATRKSS